jgi:hypothetical protein
LGNFNDRRWPTFGHRSRRWCFNIEGSFVKVIWIFDPGLHFEGQIWKDNTMSSKDPCGPLVTSCYILSGQNTDVNILHLLNGQFWIDYNISRTWWPLVTPGDLFADRGQDCQASIVKTIWTFNLVLSFNGQICIDYNIVHRYPFVIFSGLF